VVSVCGLARGVAGHYPDVDLDYLITGAVLHDIGKTEELGYQRCIGYTTQGRLLGHIAIGFAMVRKKIEAIAHAAFRHAVRADRAIELLCSGKAKKRAVKK